MDKYASEEAIMVGDREGDLAVSNRGIKIILFNPNNEIKDFLELPKVIEKIK